MLIMNKGTDNYTILTMIVPGAKELFDEMAEEMANTFESPTEGVENFDLFGVQVIYSPEWIKTKNVVDSGKEQLMKELNFVLDGKPGESVEDVINYMKTEWNTSGNTLMIYDSEKYNNNLVIQMCFGLRGLPIRTQKYLIYLLSKISSLPEEVTANDIDQLSILYHRFKDQYKDQFEAAIVK